MRAVLFVEIDIRYCSLSYGVAPCTAAIGVTGSIKCFNSPKTCQDRPNIAETDVTLRFGEDNGFPTDAISCFKSLTGISFQPGRISLGEDLGVRASVTATFRDHRHADTGVGFDKYVTERSYDPFEQGTFWGKFTARHPYLQGQALRVIRGFLPDSFSAEYPQGSPLPGGVLISQDVRHFVIESLNAIKPDQGIFEIVAKDVLKFADDDRALWPTPSTGRLAEGIGTGTGSVALTPTGIGDAEYPTSGDAVIGGNEWVIFTRSGDTLTLTSRAQRFTEAQSHAAGERVQLCYSKASITPAEYLDDLFRLGAGVPSAFIPRAAWDAECETLLNRVYSMDIAEPTPVRKLASEIIQQAALAVWWDEVDQIIRLKVLSPVSSTAPLFDDSQIVVDDSGHTSLRVQAQPNKRVSEVHTWFGQANPTEGVDEAKNYRSSRSLVDAAAVADWQTAAIRRVYSRLIPPGGAAAADRVNQIVLSRFRDPPRRFTFKTFKGVALQPVLGQGYRVSDRFLQDATGAVEAVPIIVTRLKPDHAYFEVEAEEARGGAEPEDLQNRTLIIDVNTLNVNLRTYHDQFYPTPESADTFTLTVNIESGVIVGSISTGSYAFIVGGSSDWPVGVTIRLVMRGRIQGKGGQGGHTTVGFGNGYPGGPALHVRRALIIDSSGGQIWGGGGGGAAYGVEGEAAYLAGGSGGAGQHPGEYGFGTHYNGYPGTTESGGPSANGIGGAGGGPGLKGADTHWGPNGAPGGQPGNAIDGISHVTLASSPDIRGPQVN